MLPELRLGYLTIGEPSGTPVLVLHGTAGSARSMVSPGFAGQLFGPGQALDAAKHYIFIQDALGAGKSSKPSDGQKAGFPQFNYVDILAAQHRPLTEGLGVQVCGGVHMTLDNIVNVRLTLSVGLPVVVV